MIHSDLLAILRCPVCAKEEKGTLRNIKDAWLACDDCGRKYPIVEDIPVMLMDEGEKWMNTAEGDLPIPPILNNGESNA